jgi:hypothetical protein
LKNTNFEITKLYQKKYFLHQYLGGKAMTIAREEQQQNAMRLDLLKQKKVNFIYKYIIFYELLLFL